MPPPTPPPAAPPAEEEVHELTIPDEGQEELLKEQAIREVVEHAQRLTRAVELAKPMESWRARPFVLGIMAAISVAVAGYSWVARPAWVFGPDPAAAPAPRQDAHARFAMYLVATRIAAHRQARGALPGSLRETGDHWTGFSYRVVDSASFELRSASPDITFRSTDAPGAFLGASAGQLRWQP